MLGHNGLGDPRVRRRVVDVVPVQKYNYVGILLQGSRFTEIGQHWPLLIANFEVSRQLTQGQHWNVELSGEQLEASTHIRDICHPVLAPLTSTRKELEVVHDDETRLPISGGSDP